MKKIFSILFVCSLLFACEDNFAELYQGGVTSLGRFDFNLDFESSEIDKIRYYDDGLDGHWYNIEYVNRDGYYSENIIFKLPHANIDIHGYIKSSIDWEFSNIPDWLTISPAKGVPEISGTEYSLYDYTPTSVTFTIKENDYITPRIAHVYLTGSKDGWKRVDTLYFTQYGNIPTRDYVYDTITMKPMADTVVTYINSNVELGVECIDGEYYSEDSHVADWFKASVVKSDSVGFTHKIIITSNDYIPKSESQWDRNYIGHLLFYDINSSSESENYFNFLVRVTKQAPDILSTETGDIGSSYNNPLIVSPEKNSYSLLLNANCDFSIESDSEWINATVESADESGYTHKLKIDTKDYYQSDNYHFDSKNGTISFYNNNNDTKIKIGTIYIRQERPTVTISTDSTDDNFDNNESTISSFPLAGGSRVLYFSANYNYNIKHPEWINLNIEPSDDSQYTHKMTIEVAPYSSGNESHLNSKSGNITFTYFDEVAQSEMTVHNISISQTYPQIKGGPDPWEWDIKIPTFTPKSSTYTVNFAANYDFEIEHDDWYSVKTTPIEHEYYTHQLEVTVSDYPTDSNNGDWYQRTGNLRFTYYDAANDTTLIVYNAEIRQDAPSAGISGYSLNFKGDASLDTLNVTANCLFTTSCSEEWFSVKEIITNDTTYNAQIVIQATEYPTATESSNSRSGSLTLYYKKEGSTIIKKLDYLDIYQYAHAITTEQAKSYTVTNVAQSIPLSFEAEADWTASSTVSWISTSVAQGSKGKNTININIEQLPSGTYRRSGAIELKLFNKTKLTISIEQVNVN